MATQGSRRPGRPPGALRGAGSVLCRVAAGQVSGRAREPVDGAGQSPGGGPQVTLDLVQVDEPPPEVRHVRAEALDVQNELERRCLLVADPVAINGRLIEADGVTAIRAAFSDIRRV